LGGRCEGEDAFSSSFSRAGRLSFLVLSNTTHTRNSHTRYHSHSAPLTMPALSTDETLDDYCFLRRSTPLYSRSRFTRSFEGGDSALQCRHSERPCERDAGGKKEIVALARRRRSRSQLERENDDGVEEDGETPFWRRPVRRGGAGGGVQHKQAEEARRRREKHAWSTRDVAPSSRMLEEQQKAKAATEVQGRESQ
jgi:hypothetical protein